MNNDCLCDVCGRVYRNLDHWTHFCLRHNHTHVVAKPKPPKVTINVRELDDPRGPKHMSGYIV